MQSRTRRRKKRKSGRLVLLLVLVGLLAIGCGWLINKLVVEGYLFGPPIVREQPQVNNPPVVVQPQATPPVVQPPAVTDASITLQALKVHTVQVGALNSQTGAEQLVRRLEQDGYAGAFRKEGALYKVFAGLYPEKTAALAMKKLLIQSKYEAFEKEISIAAKSAKVTGESAAYFAAAGQHIQVIEDAFVKLVKAESVDKAQASSLQQQIDQAKQAIADLKPTDKLKSVHSSLTASCSWLSTAAKHLTGYLGSNNENDLIMFGESMMEFILDYRATRTIIANSLN